MLSGQGDISCDTQLWSNSTLVKVYERFDFTVLWIIYSINLYMRAIPEDGGTLFPKTAFSPHVTWVLFNLNWKKPVELKGMIWGFQIVHGLGAEHLKDHLFFQAVT